MLSDATPIPSATTNALPTPRQHRLEASVANAIASGRPRSVIREAVERLVDQLQWQGVPAPEVVKTVERVASRAATLPLSATDVDYLALVERWATLRCARAD